MTHIRHKKVEPRPKLFGPDIFQWGRGLPREGVGAKKVGMSLETREIKLFWRDIPEFCRDVPAVPEKFEKKKIVFNFWPLMTHLQPFYDILIIRSGETDPVQFKGRFQQGPFAYKHWCFTSSFLLLGIGFL